jgi:hypothetical protein
MWTERKKERKKTSAKEMARLWLIWNSLLQINNDPIALYLSL